MKNLIVVLMGLCMILLGSVNSADATPTLTLTMLDLDGNVMLDAYGNPISIEVMDEGLNDDSLGDVGTVQFDGVFGNFNVNVTTGITYPTLGRLDLPILDLNSVNVSSFDSGGIRLEFTESGFMPTGYSGFDSSIGGSTSGSLTMRTYLDEHLLAEIGTFNDTAFSDIVSTSIMQPDNYSLTIVTDIIHAESGESSSFNAEVTVPEPGTLAMFGFGIVGLYYVRRSKTFKL